MNLLSSEILEGEFNLLKKINIDGVITTNYDQLIELAFPEFNKFIGQEELIFSELLSIGEIYKIHGCSSRPNSLVITEEDYENYDDRNAYLASKLLTIFIENPIIFIGYSLDDKNIQSILKSVIKCLTRKNVDKLKDRLIFCKWSSEPIQPTIIDSTLLISDAVLPIKLVTINDFTDLFTVLANNKRKLPIKVLKQMKAIIYDFVKSNNSKSKIIVSDNLDSIEDLHKAEFVYGVGLKDRFTEFGIKGISIKDILTERVITRNWDSEKISTLCLPFLTGSKYLPYFKYLSKAGLLNKDGKIDTDSKIKEFTPEFIKRVNSIKLESFHPSDSYVRKKEEINTKYQSFKELKESETKIHLLFYTPLLEEKKIDIKDLEDYLIENIGLIDDSKYGTHFRKLICLYDYLAFRRGFDLD